MLSRVLEPELMDTAEEAHAYDRMDHGAVNQRFVDDLLSILAPQLAEVRESPLEFLDLGTGTAQIPIEICRRTKAARVLAVDAAVQMLSLARSNIEQAGLVDRIELMLADAKQPIGSSDRFDCVMSNSIIHHLPEPIACLREAARLLRKGGLLFFRDLLRPESEIELNRLVDQYAPAAGDSATEKHQRAMFSDSLHAALTMQEMRDLVEQIGFTPDGVQATSDRHWTWTART